MIKESPEDRKGDIHLKNTKKQLDVIDFLLLCDISVVINIKNPQNSKEKRLCKFNLE